MTDSTIASQIDVLVGMTKQAPASQRISADRTTGEVTLESLPVVQSLRASSSGDVTPATFDAEAATQQHELLNSRIADLEAKLAESKYDTKTGAASPKITGRDRDLLEIQRTQMANELQWLARHALDQLPRVGDARAAQQAALEAEARRMASIDSLANSTDANGKPIGRLAAMKLIDEAEKRAMADKLVRR